MVSLRLVKTELTNHEITSKQARKSDKRFGSPSGEGLRQFEPFKGICRIPHKSQSSDFSFSGLYLKVVSLSLVKSELEDAPKMTHLDRYKQRRLVLRPLLENGQFGPF